LKESALPYFPAAVQVAPEIVPVLPFPDASLMVGPEPSSKEYAAVSPLSVLWASTSEGRYRASRQAITAMRSQRDHHRETSVEGRLPKQPDERPEDDDCGSGSARPQRTCVEGDVRDEKLLSEALPSVRASDVRTARGSSGSDLYGRLG
jgi:hypothetical protein